MSALLLLFLVLLNAAPVRAQLAGNFITVTGISTRPLSNALQIRIQADGAIRYGADYSDFLTTNEEDWQLKPTTSLRLRIAPARSRLPSYVPIDVYPVDGALVTGGTSGFRDPVFADGIGPDTSPRVEVELRFSVPVRVRELRVQPNRGTWFGSFLGPLEAGVELSNDRSTIVVTVVPDRADTRAVQRLNRSPREARKTRLQVELLSQERVRVEALHAPLGQVVAEVADALNAPLLVREAAAQIPVSLVLPSATRQEFFDALERGVAVSVREENGTFVLGRGEEFFTSREFRLDNLSPGAARSLLPDFLAPYLRPNRERNALLAFGSAPLLDKIGSDLERLDRPRGLFRIQAQAWELTATREDRRALRAAFGGEDGRLDVDFENGELAVSSGPETVEQTLAVLEFARTQGRARLRAAPFVAALSGETGTLFLGQNRFVPVLQTRSGRQTVRALELQIGTRLEATPRGSPNPNEPIQISLRPRFSTVDDLEAGTGLPTLGLRETNSTLVARDGETLVLSGLDSDVSSGRRGRSLLLPTRRDDRERRMLIVLVSVARLATSAANSAAPPASPKDSVSANADLSSSE